MEKDCCAVCSFKSGDKTLSAQHKELTGHKNYSSDFGKNKPYWCKECGKEYDTARGVEKHMQETGH